jgi:NAD(P)-dependent dehydrogenase (short-subunit alcohol dehydrogenase family)
MLKSGRPSRLKIRTDSGRWRTSREEASITTLPSSASPTASSAGSEWRALVDVKLTGVFRCTREAFGVMRRQKPQGGRIMSAAGDCHSFLALVCRHTARGTPPE